MEHFNKLTPKQAELLALLAEECGEVIQVVGKALRHGLASTHPNGGQDNKQLIEKELGDVLAAMSKLTDSSELDANAIAKAKSDKLDSVGQYLHHSGLVITEIIFQGAQEGIPAHYAVQFIRDGDTFVDYGYFSTEEEANEFAAQYGYGG